MSNNQNINEQQEIEANCIKDASPPSKIGQLIGNAFEQTVIAAIETYLKSRWPDYELLQPDDRKKTVRLEMSGGLSRQMDNVITLKDSLDPIALMETKWLKDARHHNDKGAWILQLREVRKNHPTVRGSIAILAGYWTSGVGLMLMNEGGVRMVLVATDEQVYSTLQPEVDTFFGANTFKLDVQQMRKKYIRANDLRKVLCHLFATGKLEKIARSWLEFEHEEETSGSLKKGIDLVHGALDELLAPLPENPAIGRLEIALQINTGNIIYKEFTDIEDALEFLQLYAFSPEAILKIISPKKNQLTNDANDELNEDNSN